MIKRAKRTCDKTVVMLMALLLIMGLITLFSATYYQKSATGDALAAVKKQLIGVALGAAACVVLSRVPYRFFRRPKVTLLFKTMAEYRRAEHAALRVCQICDGHFHGGRAGQKERSTGKPV